MSASLINKKIYLGLFLITLATIMYEILLTRIFSVTMWYHYAFVAVSIAMFGMTVGSIIVFIFPRFFNLNQTETNISLSSYLFFISIIFSFLSHLSIPFISTNLDFVGIFSIALNYAIISIPFIFSGITISLILTRYNERISKLYAADLVGAAIGCILLIFIINTTDGPNSILFCSLFAGIATLIFIYRTEKRGFKIFFYISFGLVFLFTSLNTYLSYNQKPLIKLRWVKGEIEPEPIYEKWNSYSRIRIVGDSSEPQIPFASGISSKYHSDIMIYQLKMDIDANAATYLTKFGGNLDSLNYLKHDVSNIVHYLKKNASICVVGSGGGRDILSALVFKQKKIIGIEINSEIIEAVNRILGNFTGNLNKINNVLFINDEARSYISRLKDSFDIIQVSLIDTWAATAAGAFVLAENTIYTIEAWRSFLNHLNNDGILTFSRWFMKDNSGEMYRLSSLAASSLRANEIERPEKNIIIIRNRLKTGTDSLTDGIGTLLVKKSPFTDFEIDQIEQISNILDFEILYKPSSSNENTFSKIINSKDFKNISSSLQVNIEPPTDDNPFFFQMLKLSDIFHLNTINRNEISRNLKAVYILFALLIIVFCLTMICIILPLIFVKREFSIKEVFPYIIFFFSIGLGFMLIEISQMQRLAVFLGHPTYSLSVVLFSLLCSSAAGSYLTSKISLKNKKSKLIIQLIIIFVLVFFAIFTPQIISMYRGEPTYIRIIIAAFMLIFIGFFLGTAFPIGISSLSFKTQNIIPWLWGINGAASVLASVFAVFISIFWGISFAFLIGIFFYIVAFFSVFLWKNNI